MAHTSPHCGALIDIDELKARSDEASFAKGVKLVGQVQQLSLDGETIMARVQGTYLYRVRIEIGRGLVSHCDCPAAVYQAFCKHGVATALAFNMSQTGQGACASIPDERGRLSRYFEGQEKSALLNLLLDEIRRDHKRWQHWLMKAGNDGQTLTPAKLKSMVTKALPKRNLWEWQEVRDYFDEAAEQFEAIWEGVEGLAIEPQWQVTLHALLRLNLVLQRIDDSNGDRFVVEFEVLRRLPGLLARLPWSDEKKCEWLFTHLIEKPMDLFPEESAFGELTHSPVFLALCEQGLARLQATGGSDDPWACSRYCAPLLAVARACGDWRRELHLLAGMASSTRDWLRLCELCCAHQEPLEGEFWLARARRQALSPYDKDACDEAEVTLCVALGEKARAWHLAKARFERSPHYEGFTRLRQLQQTLEWQDESLLPWAEQCLRERAMAEQALYSPSPHDEVVRFYLALERVQDACDWVEKYKISPELLLILADRIRPANPELAMAYTFRVAAGYVTVAHNEGYEAAVSALCKMEPLLGDDERLQASFVRKLTALTAENKRKRNFIKLVNQYFARYL